MEAPRNVRPTRTPRFRGQAFRSLLRGVAQLRGEDAVERVLHELPGGIATALRLGGIGLSGWYPIAWYADLHRAIDRACGGGAGMARELGRVTTDADLRGPFRWVLRFVSPETALRNAPRMLALYIEGATVEVRRLTRSSAELMLVGFSGCTPLIWDELLGGIERMVELTGGREVKVAWQVSPRVDATSAPIAVASVTWVV